MLNLIYKDLRVGLVFLFLAIPCFAIGASAGVRSGPVFFWISLVFAAALVLGTSQMDWRHGVDRFMHSLPVSRDLVVRARYAWALLAGALTLFVAGSAGVVQAARLTSAGQQWPRWVSADVVLAWVLLFVIIVALYLPCYFRWGHGKGYIYGALTIAGGVVAGGFISQVYAHGDVTSDLPRGLVMSTVTWAAARFGLPVAALMVLGLAGILLLVSARLAARSYRQREF